METNPQGSLGIVLTRVFWMMLGPLVMILLAFRIVSAGTGWLTAADVAFFGVLGAILLGRWLEFLGGTPQTATGEPATPAHFRRFAVGAVLLGFGVWAIAKLAGTHLLAR